MAETNVRDTSVTNQWVQLVRWARLGASATGVALALASYASGDGSSVYPGTARLALDCERDIRTVKRALSRLRDLGLIERVGRRRGSLVTEYRLTLPPLDQLRQRVTVPWVHEYDAMIDALNKAERNPSWRKRAGQQRPAQSDVQDRTRTDVQDTSPGEPSIGPSTPHPPSISGDLPTHLKVVDPVDNPVSSLGKVGSALLASLASGTDDDVCSACGVLLDPGRVCGNRQCRAYGERTP